MKRVLPNVTSTATSANTATFDNRLAYVSNVKRLSQWFYTGPRHLLSHNTTPVKWATIHAALGDGFITKYADPLFILGTGFGANTSYCMFDIDRGSRNHPSNDPRAFERFLATLDKIGLNIPVIIQSSDSGGIHVYYFFDRDINTFRIASLSQVTLIDAKFKIEDGTLENFPNCKQYGSKSNHKPHRSPLQPNSGGAILDRQGNPLVCGANLNHETQLAAFLEMAQASARGNNIDKISCKLDPVYKIFKGNPSKYQHTHKKNESESVREWREKLEVVMSIGWTGFHETNQLIKEFIEYGVVFLGLNNEKDLFEWAFKAITTAHGYSRWCRHQHEIQARIWDWIKPTLKKEFYVPYCGHPTRSRDRDNFIAKYKHSKSFPTPKAEVYKRARVESVASKISQTVQTILDTIADIPSRTSDVITLIQTIARQIFGQAFSKNTLYKLHYKHIWMKLIATKKIDNIVLVTSITPPNMEYRVETVTESAFEGSVFCVTDLAEINLKPTSGETWHSAPSVCSVIALPQPSLAHEVDPDPDLPPKLKNIPPDLDSAPQLDPQLATSSDLSTLAINSRPTPIEPDPEPSNPVPAYKKNDRVQLIDIDNREHQSTGVVCAIIGSRAMVKWDVSRKLNTYPIANLKLINPKPPEKLSDAQQTKISAEKSKYLAQLIPYSGCLVTIDAQVYGMVISVRDRDVYVTWGGGSRTYHSIDELRCTYSPCVSSFIHKFITNL